MNNHVFNNDQLHPLNSLKQLLPWKAIATALAPDWETHAGHY